MQHIKLILFVGLLLTISLVHFQSCGQVEGETKFLSSRSEQFSDYWHQGLAELNHYHLEQVRYGEVHEGDAVLIFVTEDFLPDNQVKDEGLNPKNHSVPVLKLNFTRKFNTGIYPYSLMTSVFHPLSNLDDRPLKITTSVQEWCGHTYMQLNNKNNKYFVTLNSYFEKEGDRRFEIDYAMLEDDIWLKIRLNPEMLPEGNIRMIPGMQYARLLHQSYTVQDVHAEKKQINYPELSPEPLIEYRLQYKEISRTLSIIFMQKFPHEILYWEERINPLKINGRGNTSMLTRATRSKSMLLDYWHKNALADSSYRITLGLK